jgi:hypothetical protein
MTQPISRTLAYYGSQADHLIHHAATRLQSAFDRIRHALNSVGNAFRAASYGLRQEVPFERWFFDHGFQKPITDPIDLMKAHAWALLAAFEGAMRTSAEAASYVFSRIFEPQETHRHLDVLKAQWQGLTLSMLAILSPNAAKSMADNSGRPIIGCSLLNWRWGTLYTGKLEVPLWHLECKNYPWVDRPAQ